MLYHVGDRPRALGEVRRGIENVEVALEHLGTPDDFRRYGVLRTPGLVVNEKVVCAGRVPTAAEVTSWLTDAMV